MIRGQSYRGANRSVALLPSQNGVTRMPDTVSDYLPRPRGSREGFVTQADQQPVPRMSSVESGSRTLAILLPRVVEAKEGRVSQCTAVHPASRDRTQRSVIMSELAPKTVMPIITVDSVDDLRRFYVDTLGFDHMMRVLGKDGQ